MKRAYNFGSSRLLVDLGADRQRLVPLAQDVAIQRGEAVAESLVHIAAVRSLQTRRVDGRRPLVIDRAAVLRALERWFREVEPIYATASVRKAKNNFPEEARVLETYAQSFRVANAARFTLAHLPEIHQRYTFLPGP